MQDIILQDCYTYLFFRNGIPFYVGKGQGNRVEQHFACARNHPNCKHLTCRVIRKEQREGGEITAVKIAEGIPEPAAFRLEKLYISLGAVYGWPLVNQTLGGEGTSGFRRTMPPDEKARVRQRSIERFAKPEEREKMSQGAIQRFSRLEEREKQSQRVLQHFSDPQVREAHRQRAIERAAEAPEISEEEREIRRQRALNMWSHPQYKEKRSQQGLERYMNPEEVERSRQLTNDLWQDPIYLEKMAGRYTPSVLEKMSKARSEGKPNHVGTFEGFISPQGVVYTPIINLTAFCREHQLSYCGMWLVAQDKQASHKGWTKYNP